ncbi:PREDICTED: flocculation protein FLO11-like [Drosophila arizonae]|uniref:Flocculation protein FLO11-like n=1 Tax=Drosophila arizonae TaxID=7263 RepID=A0ABM1NNY9_DROAR|nr:PREDICTED: flocculation protein FLO11-like [Drosophila arizonae]
MNRSFPSTLYGAFFLLLVAPACLGDLMCYVCDNCENVDKNTPLLACNEEFFNHQGSTEASTVTTTEMETSKDTQSTATESESTPASTSDLETSTTAVETTTEPGTTETTASTDMPIPTPATVGPPETTTGVPTPPEETGMHRLEISTQFSDATDLENSTDLYIRQRRALIDTDISYHCYKVEKTVNNVKQVDRGCSRVKPEQSVCQELQLQNVGVQLSHCDPCTMNACNAATSTVHASILATVAVALTAVVLQLKSEPTTVETSEASTTPDTSESTGSSASSSSEPTTVETSEASTTIDTSESTGSSASSSSEPTTVETSEASTTIDTSESTGSSASSSSEAATDSSTSPESTTINEESTTIAPNGKQAAFAAGARSGRARRSLAARAADQLIRNYRSLEPYARAVEYRTAACYSIEKDGGKWSQSCSNCERGLTTTKCSIACVFDFLSNRVSFLLYSVLNRGCVRIPVGQSGCQAVREKVGLPEDAVGDLCDVCQMDRCNGSGSLRMSLAALLLLVGIGLKSLF